MIEKTTKGIRIYWDCPPCRYGAAVASRCEGSERFEGEYYCNLSAMEVCRGASEEEEDEDAS